MTGIKELSAVVSYRAADKGGNSKTAQRVVTDASIMLGSFVVATHTLGGKLSQQEVMREFAKNDGRFKKQDGYPAAQALRLVA